MDAIFLAKVRGNFPEVRFKAGNKFSFRPPKTVFFDKNCDENFSSLLLLHELGHFLCGKFEFKTEIERLKIEVLAWEKAKKLAPLYGILIDEELIENELNSYRNWLHQKSRCPSCGLTRFQTLDGVFYCPKCDV